MTKAKLVRDVPFDSFTGLIIPEGTTGVLSESEWDDFDYQFDFDSPIDGIDGVMVMSSEVEIIEE